MSSSTIGITQFLHAASRQEACAAEELMSIVYEELRRLAGRRIACESAGQTLQATALVHEAWLRLVENGERTWQSRGHFFGAAVRAMRRILIENARRKSRQKRGGSLVRLDFDALDLAESPDEKVLLINDALEQLEAQDPEKAQVVMLKFFGGCTNQEVAACLGTTERTIERHWAFARAWLFQCIRAAQLSPAAP